MKVTKVNKDLLHIKNEQSDLDIIIQEARGGVFHLTVGSLFAVSIDRDGNHHFTRLRSNLDTISKNKAGQDMGEHSGPDTIPCCC